jgi:hypothetical protein
MPYDTQVLIPAFTVTEVAQMEGDTGVLPEQGTGWIFVRVLQTGAPLPGAVASATPQPDFATLYDGASASSWNQDHTGPYGVAWVPGEPTGAASISVTPQGGSATMINGIPVTDGGVTFITADIP